jgi:hypothetical protein
MKTATNPAPKSLGTVTVTIAFEALPFLLSTCLDIAREVAADFENGDFTNMDDKLEALVSLYRASSGKK